MNKRSYQKALIISFEQVYSKGEKIMKGKILDDMAKQGHCFISDLHCASFSNQIVELLKEFPFEHYSLEECSYCFSYIFDQPFSFKQRSEIYAVIKDLP